LRGSPLFNDALKWENEETKQKAAKINRKARQSNASAAGDNKKSISPLDESMALDSTTQTTSTASATAETLGAIGQLTPSGATLAERLAWAGEPGLALAREPWAAAAWEKLEQAQWGFAILRALRTPERPTELWGAKALAEDGVWKFRDWDHPETQEDAQQTRQALANGETPSKADAAEKAGEAAEGVSVAPGSAPHAQAMPAWAKLAESFASDWAMEEAGRLAVAAQALGGGRAWLAPSKTEWEGPGLPSQARPTGLLLAALIAAAKRAAKTNPLAEEILPALLDLEDNALNNRVAPDQMQQAHEVARKKVRTAVKQERPSQEEARTQTAAPSRKRGPRR